MRGGGGLMGFGVPQVGLPERVLPGAVFPLWALHADPMLRCPGSPDSPMCGPHQSDGNPNLDVTARPRVGFLTLCCQATSYSLQGSRCLHT